MGGSDVAREVVVVRSGKGTVDGGSSFTDIVETVVVSVRKHSGWESATYKGKRYQVFGGIRNPLFIVLDHPLKGRK